MEREHQEKGVCMKSKEKKLTEEQKQKAIDNYIAWAYADPGFKEFTNQLVFEYLDTGVVHPKEEIEKRFRKYLDDRLERKT